MIKFLWISIGVCALALLVLAFALYRVDSGSSQRDQAFDRANQAAIVQNCQEIESVKASLRLVFDRLARFNLENGTPAAAERARLYSDFVHDYFSSNSCPRKEAIP